MFLLILCTVFKVHAQDLNNIKHYTTDDGLPHNICYNIHQDYKGYIWIGTDNGLARFDGNGFKLYQSSDGLLSNYIIDIAEAEDSTLWIGSWKGGVNCIKNDLIFTPVIDKPLNKVAYIAINNDQLVLSDLNYCIYPYKRESDQWNFNHDKSKESLYLNNDFSIVYDNKIYIKNKKKILKQKGYQEYLWNIKPYLSKENKLLLFGRFPGIWEYKNDSTSLPFYPDIIKNDTIYHISQDRKGNYWLGGKGKITVINPEGKHTTIQKGLPDEKIHELIVTPQNHIYFLTGFNDLNKRGFYNFNPSTTKLMDLRSYLNIKVLPAFLKLDKENNVWLSTNGDGLFCIPTSPFNNIDDQNGLSNVFVTRINQNSEGNMLIGTLSNLYVLNDSYSAAALPLLDNQTSFVIRDLIWESDGYGLANILVKSKKHKGYHLIKFNKQKKEIISSGSNHSALFIDSQKRLWTFTNSGKILWNNIQQEKIQDKWNTYQLDPKIKVLQFFEYQNSLALATNRGIFFFEEKISSDSKPTLQFSDSLTVKDGLSDNYINQVAKDKNDILWAATNKGISSISQYKILNFNQEDGLLSDICKRLLIDPNGLLWIGTTKGLSCFDGKNFLNYNHKTGLISSDVNSLFLDQNQKLWVGTSKGISIIDVNKRPKMNAPPPLQIENFEVNGMPIDIYPNLKLSYHSNMRISYNALVFKYPESIRYQYRMNKGKWQNTTNTFIDYNLLNSGSYQFEIRSKKFNSNWSAVKSLQFEVLPPLWLEWWAISSYIISLLFIFYAILRWRSNKLKETNYRLEQLVSKRTNELEQQKTEVMAQAEKLKELDKIKTDFFSNISHELRTPLTLIMGPAERLFENGKDENTKTLSKSILNNSERLQRLINQLLDIEKVESGKMVIQPQKSNLNNFLKNIINSFELLCKQKNISLKLEACKHIIYYHFDHDKFEKVFFNLISNAIKFTPNNGAITIKLYHKEEDIYIKVSDTGIGIPAKVLPSIFDRFYQVDSTQTREQEGTGIGLALVKELIEIHNGTIQVESTLNQGTTFIIQLKMDAKDCIYSQPSKEVTFNSITSLKEKPQQKNKDSQSQNKADTNTILLVEDNLELRKFIAEGLSVSYQILQASDGEQGIKKALEHIPDMIISDVMMPKSDGFELLKTLREHPDTSHIPILMLTAKASFESKIFGLETGSDDYLTKPFSFKELELRIRNIFERRDKARDLFKKHLSSSSSVLKITEVNTTSMDDAFLKKAIQIVEKNIQNFEFDVTLFCQEIGMSQSNLFRKLKALTNLSTTQFIRSIRIKRAASLLKQNSGRIDEIAFEVGFNDVSYFNRCFKKQFGIPPTEFRQEHLERG